MPNSQAQPNSHAHFNKTPKPDEPDEVVKLLGDIKAQNETMMIQFDTLETNISRRATMAGAMAGAFTGGVGGTVISVGIELIKAKFGG
jgi:hypothetical protein